MSRVNNREPERLPPVQTHWMRPLQRGTFPRRHFYLDSEAFMFPLDDDAPDGAHDQRFRLASAMMERRSKRLDRWIQTPMQHFTSTHDLWMWVDKNCTREDATVLWCHNLGYDMLITAALVDLPNMGWDFTQFYPGDDVAWAVAKRGTDGAIIKFSDLFSWCPTSLETIGKDLGIPKVELPEEDETDDVWFERCDRDVEILMAACHVIRDWMVDNQLGPWRTTGAGAGFGVWKYSFLREKTVLCHGDENVRTLERHSEYAGRCESFQVGMHDDVYEYDYRNAYLALCDRPLPVRMKMSVRIPLDAAREYCRGDWLALVTANVTVPTCRLPVLPYHASVPYSKDPNATRVVWPTGTFTSTWWLDELEAAIARGATVNRVDNVVMYRSDPVLADWAAWATEQIDVGHPLVKRVVKQWGRTVVGRFGMSYPVYVPAHTNPDFNIWSGLWVDGETDEPPRKSMQIGYQCFVEDGVSEGRDTLPAVLSYIMMLCRMRLLAAIETAGIDDVIYCDTDGLLVTHNGSNRLEAQPLDGLRVKHHYDTVHVIGPKQLILDNQPRVSGLPSRRAERRNSDGSWQVQVWDRMGAALESGRIDRVRVRTASMYVRGDISRRTPDPQRAGFTLPPVVVA